MLKSLIAAILFTFASSGLYAQSVQGVWTFAMSSQMGSVDAQVTMKIDGDELTGEFDVGNGRTWAIEDGKIEGNSISFNINRDGASMTYAMAGDLNGDTIMGTASAMGSVVPWSMSRDN